MTCAVPDCSSDVVMQGVCSAHWLEADEAANGADRLDAEASAIARERSAVIADAEREWVGRRLKHGVWPARSRYEAYLASKEWAVTRALAIRDANGRCYVCMSRQQLEVHHLTYVRLGHEDPDDMVVLCGRCHALVHDKPQRSQFTPRWDYSWGTGW